MLIACIYIYIYMTRAWWFFILDLVCLLKLPQAVLFSQVVSQESIQKAKMLKIKIGWSFFRSKSSWLGPFQLFTMWRRSNASTLQFRRRFLQAFWTAYYWRFWRVFWRSDQIVLWSDSARRSTIILNAKICCRLMSYLQKCPCCWDDAATSMLDFARLLENCQLTKKRDALKVFEAWQIPRGLCSI